MSVQTESTDKPSRRKRRTPTRRVPSIIEQPTARPFLFGWGADLTKGEREAVKERIALFAGIGLAVVLAALLGWGWYQDNVAAPAARAADNNTPIAKVGSYTVKKGFFKSFEQYEQSSINNQLTQLSQEISQAQANPKKYGAIIPQLQSQQNSLQQQLSSLAANALQTILTDQTILQGYRSAGVSVSNAAIQKNMKKIQDAAGGRLHLLQSIGQSNLAYSDFQWVVTAEFIGSKLQKKLSATVSPYQMKVRASHILITKDHKLALRLYHEVLHGANFAALARKYSQDPGSAKKGGDLGYFTHGQMVAPFDQAAFAMKVGQIRLIHSQYGWHIIKVTGRQKAHLTGSAYTQAQQSAFDSWIAKEQGLLGVRRYVAPQNLPGSQSQSSVLPNTSTQNLQPAPAAPPPAPAKVGKSKSHAKTGPATKKK